MKTDERGETVVNVRLKGEDRDALEWAIEQVQRQAGPGVFVSAGSAVRWALHMCRDAFTAADNGEG